jgi:hypothetical protein
MTTQLAKLKTLLQTLSGPLRVQITPTDPESPWKLERLKVQGIDFLEVDAEMLIRASKAMEGQLPQALLTEAPAQSVLQAVGNAVLQRVLDRWRATEGQDPAVRPGYQTGALYESLLSAQVRVTK